MRATLPDEYVYTQRAFVLEQTALKDVIPLMRWSLRQRLYMGTAWSPTISQKCKGQIPEGTCTVWGEDK